jgi:hypothetical protein
MGLSIHFKGNLSSGEMLPLLIEEVKDICENLKWPATVFETAFPKNSFEQKSSIQEIYGICFSPPESEPVSLCFLSNGNLVSIFSWAIFVNDQMKDESILLSDVSVKTQYAGPTIHKMIIHLLEYISKKYLSQFRMMDEGQYWETRDEALLERNFAFLTDLLNRVGNMIETTSLQPEESFESYFERIMKKIRDKE